MARHPERTLAPPRAASSSRAAVLSLVLAGVVLTGCTAPDAQAPSPSPSLTDTATPVPTEPAPPALVPDGTAADNLPLFTEVTASVWATEDRVSGRAYVDALTAAGFDRSAMQVTPDLSTVGNPAESIQFSVLWGAECLVGQVGPATGDPVTIVVPVLAEGMCLVGQTRPIDW